jgi:CBS-domain-containing membrane protein
VLCCAAGVPLLLGSFGTLAILLFGKPEAEPVRLWSIIAGQLGATAIVMAVLHVWGANLVSRAAAMAATVAWQMWTDCIHPPGGVFW